MRAVVAALLLLAALGAQAQTLRDDLGREVAIVGAGKRIATLSPFLTEAAFAVHAGAEVVGVSEFSDFPAYAKRIATVSSATGIHWERLMAVRPDLALAWKDSLKEGDVERFERAGVRLFVFAGRRLADVPRVLRAVSLLTGRTAEPEIAGAFEKRVQDLRREHAGKPRVGVFLEVSHRPLITIAGEHFINDALSVCGAENLFAALPGVAPEVSWETLLERDPAIVVGAGGPDGEAAFRARWSERATLRAVKANALVYVNADHLFRPSPRLTLGIEDLCRGIDAVRNK